ncbi:MAG: family 10 glycosylhydrolase [Proteobacteria bacterium]|nr:family 10 glycosylhydrolase [Pseudomonadota bacterium]MCP4915709.1 family 10 glycosylhydrolase [Pseudomonadota bacterium]
MWLWMLGCTAAPEAALADNASFRVGAWVTRWSYSSEEDVRRLVGELDAAGVDTVYFQVRGTFDAYYLSEHEPWAERLSGTLGQDPGWDPLGVALDEAGQRDMAVHAWLNTFPIWRGTDTPTSTGVPHPLTAHPDWVVWEGALPQAPNDSYLFADPGRAEVRAHIAQVAGDIDARYDVAGIHLDYIRYHAKGAGTGPREAHIEATAQAVNDAVGSTTSAAVWGIHENRWGWDNVSEGRPDFGQDSHGMLASGAIDAAMPMIYWPVADVPGERLDFATLVQDHVDRASGKPVHAGISPDAMTPQQVKDAVAAARSAGAAGVVFFDAVAFLDDRKTVDPLQ